MKQLKIFVTGGRGYKGQAIIKHLHSKGHDITSLDIGWFEAPEINLPGVNDIVGSTLDIQSQDLIGFDVVLHLAAVANDPSGDINSKLTWETNVLATNNLAYQTVKAGVERFIFASSGSVYGVQDVEHVTENVEPVPISDYNKTKWVGERILLSYAKELNLQIVRPGTVCGLSDRQRFDVVVNLFCEQAVTRKKLLVLGGEQMRPHIHIDDMCLVYEFLLNNPQQMGTFNTSFENLSVKDLAVLIADMSGANIEYAASNDPRSYRMNSDKILSAGFKPEKSVRHAVSEIVDAVAAGHVVNSTKMYNVKWMQDNINY